MSHSLCVTWCVVVVPLRYYWCVLMWLMLTVCMESLLLLFFLWLRCILLLSWFNFILLWVFIYLLLSWYDVILSVQLWLFYWMVKVSHLMCVLWSISIVLAFLKSWLWIGCRRIRVFYILVIWFSILLLFVEVSLLLWLGVFCFILVALLWQGILFKMLLLGIN